MRCKCQRRRFAPKRARTLARRPDHGSMTAMDTVKIANRHYGTGKRAAINALRAATCDMEVFCRHRAAHWMLKRA
jgi:hypothetical protein